MTIGDITTSTMVGEALGFIAVSTEATTTHGDGAFTVATDILIVPIIGDGAVTAILTDGATLTDLTTTLTTDLIITTITDRVITTTIETMRTMLVDEAFTDLTP